LVANASTVVMIISLSCPAAEERDGAMFHEHFS
jgi:hypothetical protein